MNTPRLRTISKAIEEIRAIDPNTCFTATALRRMVANGEIPVICVASKKLVNLDFLLENLAICSYNKTDLVSPKRNREVQKWHK